MRICIECDTDPVGSEIICETCGASFEEINLDAGMKVKAARVEKGMSLRGLAVVVGVSAQTIARVERQCFPMSQEKIVLMASVLGFNGDQLLLDFGRCPSDAVPRTVEEIMLIRSMRAGGDGVKIAW